MISQDCQRASYEWREISTADGYMISSKKAITVSADKTATTEFINKASAPDKGKITIHKRDAETRADLEGAKFEVAASRGYLRWQRILYLPERNSY
ncbi:collagen binding domain-containing protein [Ruminococcus sp.]|uniref:MSCRAMM family protein n=1 Tax=Ruminococcus sp. TaxID=41978 RepID=UPI0039A37FC1